MIRAMRQGLGRRAGLFLVPRSLLAAALQTMGQIEIYRLLSGSLVADSSALSQVDWVPVTSTRAGLEALVRNGNHGTWTPRIKDRGAVSG
jgi:UDP-glucose 4-epimerase